MDMTGDIKRSMSSSGPLLPNPANGGANGYAHLSNLNSSWPVLDGTGSPAPGSSSKTELLSSGSNGRIQVRLLVCHSGAVHWFT